jgi:hypothetical protein
MTASTLVEHFLKGFVEFRLKYGYHRLQHLGIGKFRKSGVLATGTHPTGRNRIDFFSPDKGALHTFLAPRISSVPHTVKKPTFALELYTGWGDQSWTTCCRALPPLLGGRRKFSKN